MRLLLWEISQLLCDLYCKITKLNREIVGLFINRVIFNCRISIFLCCLGVFMITLAQTYIWIPVNRIWLQNKLSLAELVAIIHSDSQGNLFIPVNHIRTRIPVQGVEQCTVYPRPGQWLILFLYKLTQQLWLTVFCAFSVSPAQFC